MAAATSVHVVTIIEPIIQHADWFFPDGMYPMYKSVFIFKHFVWSHQNDVKKLKSHTNILHLPQRWTSMYQGCLLCQHQLQTMSTT